MRILLVEDDAILGDGILAGLKLADYAVDWVREEIDACRKYRRGGEAPETLDEPAPLDDSATPATTKTTRRRLRRRLRILRTNPQDESRDADRGAE